jgi:hypothetical protein
MITIRKNNLTKRISTGYSWKLLFFGILYPIARNDFKGVFIHFILAIFTFWVGYLLIVPFTYNKAYLNRMLEDGWEIIL